MTRIYVDMDDVLCQFSKAYQRSKVANSDLEYPQSIEGFFLALEPMPNGIDVVNRFRSEFDVYILTAPSTRNPHSYTEKRLWIEKYFDYDFTKRLILSPNKALLKGDYLIDDYDKGKGQDKFEGILIHFGTPEFPDWQAVEQYFQAQYLKG